MLVGRTEECERRFKYTLSIVCDKTDATCIFTVLDFTVFEDNRTAKKQVTGFPIVLLPVMIFVNLLKESSGARGHRRYTNLPRTSFPQK